jgi:hypothetical protein
MAARVESGTKYARLVGDTQNTELQRRQNSVNKTHFTTLHSDSALILWYRLKVDLDYRAHDERRTEIGNFARNVMPMLAYDCNGTLYLVSRVL